MKKLAAVSLLALAAACITVQGGQKADARTEGLRIYLLRTAVVKGRKIRLADISIIRGQEVLVTKAQAVPMGRSPFAGEPLILSRRTILSRLAASGIPSAGVTLTGARKVTITVNQRIFTREQILESARKYLTGHRPGPAGAGWSLAHKVEDLVVEAGKGIKLRTTRMVGKGDYVHLKVLAVSEGRELGVRNVVFRVTYSRRQAVAKATIPAGGVFTTDNTDIRTVSSFLPPAGNWSAPYGLTATKQIKSGAIIRPEHIRRPKDNTLRKVVKRNQPVTMIIRGAGFTVTSTGLAMRDGKVGDFIKVRNLRSKQDVIAKVLHDGSVEPMGR